MHCTHLLQLLLNFLISSFILFRHLDHASRHASTHDCRDLLGIGIGRRRDTRTREVRAKDNNVHYSESVERAAGYEKVSFDGINRFRRHGRVQQGTEFNRTERARERVGINDEADDDTKRRKRTGFRAN